MRVLLKLSGEALSGEGEKGFKREALDYVVQEVKPVLERGVRLGIVVGAGNIFRGDELENISRERADQIGLLGTVMNSIYLKDWFEKYGIKCRVFSQIVNLPDVEQVNYSKIDESLENGYLLIFGGGTSNPFFTTDTAAVLRAKEMKANIIIKATKVDGVYDRDPKKHSDAKKIEEISFSEALRMNLRVMDAEAFSMCQKLGITVKIIDFFKPGNLLKALSGERVGSTIFPG